jgi:hypothetical protein
MVAVGAYGNDGAGSWAGHVRVFKFDGTAWVKMGDDIDGEAAHDYAGYGVAMSSNGRMVAVGAYGNDGAGFDAGHVRTYALNGDWTSDDDAFAPSGDAGGSSSTGAICFTGDSLLTLEDSTTKKFRDLQVGDMIMGADRYGNVSFSPVIFLPHKPNDIQRKFDEITTGGGSSVRMTRNHLIPLCDSSLVTARSLKTGDCLMTANGEDTVAKVTMNVEAGGIYTAVTKNEFLVVDGVVASPFALAHGVAHSFFDRDDVTDWCKKNNHLLPAAEDKEVKALHARRKLLFTSNHNDSVGSCVTLMKTLFDNYKDEGVGWGMQGWGYRMFKTMA